MGGSPSVPINTTAFADAEKDERAQLEHAAWRYLKPLRGFFMKRVRNPADVDDLVQEVFLQLVQRAHNNKDGAAIEHMEHYTFQAAANVLRDRSRRDLVRQRGAHESLDETVHTLATEITPERIVLGEEGIALVESVLRQLPERTRDVFMLRWIGKHSFPEIADKLDMSTRGAQRHMASALKHLAGVLN